MSTAEGLITATLVEKRPPKIDVDKPTRTRWVAELSALAREIKVEYQIVQKITKAIKSDDQALGVSLTKELAYDARGDLPVDVWAWLGVKSYRSSK